MNDGRLYALGLAAQCVADHPWQGGGSHSFSWESRHHWNAIETGWDSGDTVYVHNEFMQAMTDYGLIGAILLASTLACLFGNALIELAWERRSSADMPSDAWLAGAVAGAAAILTQSNFAFVFHNLPSSILLGFFLGIMAWRSIHIIPSAGNGSPHGFPVAMGYGLVGGALLVAGIQGTRALVVMWPAEYAKNSRMKDCPVIAAGNLAQAAGYWPDSELYMSQAKWLLRAANITDEGARIPLLEEAEAAWREARRLHPLNPVLAVNHANTLGYLGSNLEALAAYDEAIRLQGGYECGVRAYYHKGLHLCKMSFEEIAENRTREALDLLKEANRCFRKVREQTSWYYAKSFPEEQLHALETTAALQAQLGLDSEMDGTLLDAISLPNGQRANYLVAMRLYEKARGLWYGRQPGKALALFMKAREKLTAAAGAPPPGFTPYDREKLGRDIDDSIIFLQGAQVKAE